MRTAVAERQRDHAVGHSGEEPNRELERSAGIIEANPILVCKADRFGCLRADERGVIPGQLRQGIGKLLQPPVVREAAVVKRGRGEEHDLQIARRSRRGAKAAELRQGLPGEVGDNFWKLAAGQKPIVQNAVPGLVELRLTQDRFPGLPHDVVAGTILAPDHQPKHLDWGPAAEQREDQRLDDAERASNRARVSPRFEVMRAGNVPARFDGCFVDRVPERDRLRDLRHGRGEVEIGGSIEDRIAAEDDERLYRARVHRGDERSKRADTWKRRILRLVIGDCLARVTEIGVQRADGGMDGRRLAFASHDQPFAAVRQEILGKGVDPARVDTRDAGSREARGSGLGRSNARSERREKWSDLPALKAEPMISHRSRQ